MPSLRMLAVSFGSTLLCISGWPSTPAGAQVLERGVEGAAVGAIIGGIVGGGKGAATGAGIGAGVGVLSGAAEANARAQGYYGPPPAYGPPPPGYYGPPPRYGSAPHGYYGPPHAGYAARPPRAVVAASISVAPPPLPVYDQPPCPEPGYVWTPGYWAYAAGGYYWVPGTWVMPPAVGLVWTPGYWGYSGQRYLWNAGYWGPHVGYYGGINYGFGYFGSGYEGGHWDNGVFFYNTSITRVNTAAISSTYNATGTRNVTANNVSFNGPGGITAQPTTQEVAWSRERRTQPTALQIKHQRTASTNRALFAAANHGTPTVAATAKPGVFKGPDIVAPNAVATTNASATGSAVPDGKGIPHAEKGIAPVASGEAASGAGKQAPARPQNIPASTANGGAAPDQHTSGRSQGVDAAAANGGAALAKPDAPSAVVVKGGAPDSGKHALSGPNSPGGAAGAAAGPGIGKQVPNVPPGPPAAVAPGRPNGAAVAVTNGGPGTKQHATANPHGPDAKSGGGSSKPQGDPAVVQSSPKPQVKKNKPDQDTPPETAQNM
jgi:WXXGXW repeat (2 copies)